MILFMKKNQRNKPHKKQQSSGPAKASRWWWMIGVLIILSAMALMFWPGTKSTVPANPALLPPSSAAKENVNAGQEQLVGRWVRNDGGYVIEIRSVGSNGKMEAFYFNPNPVHVGRAEWEQKNNTIIVVVALSDVNYPGSTYTLEFIEGEDRLKGMYYQAVENVNFDVEFAREQ
jgi:hypothetical protein